MTIFDLIEGKPVHVGKQFLMDQATKDPVVTQIFKAMGLDTQMASRGQLRLCVKATRTGASDGPAVMMEFSPDATSVFQGDQRVTTCAASGFVHLRAGKGSFRRVKPTSWDDLATKASEVLGQAERHRQSQLDVEGSADLEVGRVIQAITLGIPKSDLRVTTSQRRRPTRTGSVLTGVDVVLQRGAVTVGTISVGTTSQGTPKSLNINITAPCSPRDVDGALTQRIKSIIAAVSNAK